MISPYYHINEEGKLVQGSKWLGGFYEVCGWWELEDDVRPVFNRGRKKFG